MLGNHANERQHPMSSAWKTQNQPQKSFVSHRKCGSQLANAQLGHDRILAGT